MFKDLFAKAGDLDASNKPLLLFRGLGNNVILLLIEVNNIDIKTNIRGALLTKEGLREVVGIAVVAEELGKKGGF